MATYIAEATRLALLDDPSWVFERPDGVLLHRQVPTLQKLLQATPIVKAPRLSERLGEVKTDFPGVRIIFMLRDPVDTFASIMQKVRRTDNPTRMLDFTRFGDTDSALEGFALQYSYYLGQARMVLREDPNAIALVSYESLYKEPEVIVEEVLQILNIDVTTGQFIPTTNQLGPLRNKPLGRPEVIGPGHATLEIPEVAERDLRSRVEAARDELWNEAEKHKRAVG